MNIRSQIAKLKNKAIFNRSVSFFTDIFFFDALAIPLTRVLAKISFLTPNHVTVISGLFGLLSAWQFFNLNYFLGFILIYISFLLDCVDGDLARKTGKTSPFGATLDNTMDSLKKAVNLFVLAYISSYNFYLVLGLIVLHYALLRLYPTRYKEEVKDHKYTKLGLEPFFEPYDLLVILLLFGPIIHFEAVLCLVILIQLIASTYSRKLKI